MLKKIFLFLFWLIIFFNQSFAQPYTKVAEYNVNNGLSSNSILSITKDLNGFYWIRTFDDFCRWDGHLFEKPTNHQYAENKKNIDIVASASTILEINENSHYKIKSNNHPFTIDKSPVNFDIAQLKKNSSKQDFDFFVNFIKYNFIKPHKTYCLAIDSNNYYLINDNRDHLHINNNTIGRYYKKNVEDFIFFIEKKFITISKTTNVYTVYDKDSLVQKGILKGALNNKEPSIEYFQQIKDKTLVLLGNKLLNTSLDNNNNLDYEVVNKFTSTEYFQSFFYDTLNHKILIATSVNGLQVFENPIINIKNSGNITSSNFIYAQCLLDGSIINFWDIYSKNLYKKYSSINWAYNGAICSLNNNSILAGSLNSLLLLDKQLQTKKTFNLFGNSSITNFLITDSVVYFINNNLNKYYPATNTIKTTTITDFPQNGSVIQAMYAAQKANTIYAVIGKTLQAVNLRKNIATTIANGIVGEVRSLLYDSTNQYFFIATRNNGCYFFKENCRLKKLPNPINTINFNCHYVLPDMQGDYWLPTNKGLYCVLKKDFENFANSTSKTIAYKKFGKEDGITNEEFNGGFSGCGLLKGDSIYMGTQGGTVIFNSSIKYIQKKDDGEFVIDYVKVDDSLRNPTQLKLNPNFKQISFKVAYPFINDKNDFIEYSILSSNDTTWIYLEKSAVVTINNLRAGTYKAVFKLHSNAQKIIEIPFEVMPYWYNTWWARCLFVLLICFGVYVIFMWQMQIYKNKNLEIINNSRTNLFNIIAHDLQSPIKSYIGLADDIKYLIKKRDFDGIDMLGNAIDQKSRNLSLLVQNVLSWSSSQQGIHKLTLQEVVVSDLINEILPVYIDIATFRDIKIVVDNNVDTALKTDRNAFSLILRNLIDNAIKYSPNNTFVNIKFYKISNQYKLEISNTFLPNQLKELLHIKNIFSGSLKGDPHTNNMGLGIVSLYNNVVFLKASCSLVIKSDIAYFKIIFTA